MSGFQTDFLEGWAVYLAAAGIGATWNPTGAYTALQLGIVLRKMPEEPNRVIVLSAYGIGDDPSLSDSDLGLQVRCRWEGSDPRPVDDLDDSIFDLLQGLCGVTLSTGVRVVQCLRRSQTSLGQDASERWSTSANYAVTVWRPSRNRT